MRAIELETWVHRVVEQVRAGKPNEDFRVELKRSWIPDHHAVARRLGGHANAARGDKVLWIIGVDPSGDVPGAMHEDLASWWPAVQKFFDEIPPELVRDMAVPFGEATLVALLFNTDRAPFVVTASPQQGAIQREVPWREGTRVRSAHRQDVIRLLGPIRRLPEVETTHCSVTASDTMSNGKELVLWDLAWHVFVTPYETPTFVIPHRCHVALERADGTAILRTVPLDFGDLGDGTVHEGSVRIEAPRLLRMDTRPLGARERVPEGDMLATLTLSISGADAPVVLQHRLAFATSASHRGYWDAGASLRR